MKVGGLNETYSKGWTEKNLCGTIPLENGLKNEVLVRFEVFKLLVLRIMVFWDIRVYRSQCFKGTLAMDPHNP
jgi:hypothetical protein